MEKSQEIDKLAKALSDAQGEFTPVPKDSTNPFFKNKYADLSTIIEHTKAILNKHGLCVSQVCEGENSVTTTLLHNSGQYLSGTLTLKPQKADPQGMGSAITYARRYALQSILGINTEDDDDANEASKQPAKKPADKPKSEPEPQSKQSSGKPNDAQIKRLQTIVSVHKMKVEDIKLLLKTRYKVDSSKDLTIEQYNELCGDEEKGIPCLIEQVAKGKTLPVSMIEVYPTKVRVENE